MATAHNINEALSKARGVPAASVEQYARALRQGGLFPETKRGAGAVALSTEHAALLLAAVLRGSTTNAAANASDIGGLVAHATGVEWTILQRQCELLGWPPGVKWAGAVADLIDRLRDGTSGEILHDQRMNVGVDRYWTVAWVELFPTLEIRHESLKTWREKFHDAIASMGGAPAKPAKDEGPIWPDPPWASPLNPMRIEFHSPLLHEQYVSYGVDPGRNKSASLQFQASKRDAAKHDRWGTEWVTGRTMQSIADAFK